MRRNWKPVIFLVSVILFSNFIRTEAISPDFDVYANGIPEDASGHTEEAEEESENRDISEVIRNVEYVRVQPGDAYIGSSLEYDIRTKRTLVQPNSGERQVLLRRKNEAVMFYGRYRGVRAYPDYEELSLMLDAEFFLTPFLNLNLTEEEVREKNYQIELTRTRQVEEFVTPLSFVGILDSGEVQAEAVILKFDGECRPVSVDFRLKSETVGEEQLRMREEELSQKYSYDEKIPEEGEIEYTNFEQRFDAVLEEIENIVPEDEVEPGQYIGDLTNVARAADESFVLILNRQSREMLSRDGWDRRAVFAYLEAVDARFEQLKPEGQEAPEPEVYMEELERTFEEVHKVGSDVYTYMFGVSGLEPKEKALLVIRQMGGYMDGNEMLQLAGPYRFDSEMPPHAEFLEDYAQCVQTAYQKKNGRYKVLDSPKIHQFRMYIDRHNISYVRSHFQGASDYEKLKAYAAEYEFALYYGEPSRHHNKISQRGRFQTQEYDKVLTPNRLSEFIVDVKSGRFVTEWDVLKIDKVTGIVSNSGAYKEMKAAEGRTLVDTESFNYAPANHGEAHDCLDVRPASPPGGGADRGRAYLENGLKKAMKEIWRSPTKYVYREKYRSAKDYALPSKNRS